MALTGEDKEWIDTRLEQMETKLLTAFQKWASPLEARMRTHTVAIKAVDAELSTTKSGGYDECCRFKIVKG